MFEIFIKKCEGIINFQKFDTTFRSKKSYKMSPYLDISIIQGSLHKSRTEKYYTEITVNNVLRLNRAECTEINCSPEYINLWVSGSCQVPSNSEI